MGTHPAQRDATSQALASKRVSIYGRAQQDGRQRHQLMRERRTIRCAVSAVLSVAALALGASPVLAAPSARLTYVRDSGAEHCPDEAVLRHAVEQRLGYDPFFPWADRTMVARIRSDGRGLHGTVEMLDKTGLVQGSREISAPTPQCTELVSGMALAISIAVDPSSVERGAGADVGHAAPDDAVIDWSSARAEEAASRPPPSPASRDAISPSARRHSADIAWVPELDAGVAGAIGVMPAVALGPRIGGALRRRAWSLGIEGRYLLAFDSTRDGKSVSSTLLEGMGLGCIHVGMPFACVAGSIGRVAVSGNVAQPNHDAALVARLGPRLGVELAVTPEIAVLAQADVAFNLGRQSIQIDSQGVWKSSLVGGFTEIAVRGRFP
jgi:hypothetical protein